MQSRNGHSFVVGQNGRSPKKSVNFHADARSRERTLLVFGTRPEAIKMAPVVLELKRSPHFDIKVCVTAQHRHMLDQVLSIFGIVPDFDLNVMAPNQHLTELAATMLKALRQVFLQWRPDLILVQGDTTTTLAASLAAFYDNIPVAHIEAGLRTGDLLAPWPEEANRKLTAVLAKHHFAPTDQARQNLLAEGIDNESITVTGNTVIDALANTLSHLEKNQQHVAAYDQRFSYLRAERRLVLVTGHRRENFGEAFKNICMALRELAQRSDVELLYPVHLNPNVRQPVHGILGGVENVHLIEPQEYEPFCYLLNRCYLIITDSGGIQEEATYLRKPVLLMRNTTERPEAVEVGTVKLAGTDGNNILAHAHRLLDDAAAYKAMTAVASPFGDGFAARRIVTYLEKLMGERCETGVH